MGHSEVDREIGFIKRRNDVVVKTFGKVQEINSFEGGWNSCHGSSEQWTKLVVNFDTGAAVTAVPLRVGKVWIDSGR